MKHESLNIEYKREYTEDIKKAVIAFANTDGGDIYIGVDDNGMPVGIDNIDETILKLNNSIRDSICPDISIFTSLEIVQMEKKDVIKLRVDRGTSRPYYLCAKGIRPTGVYLRQGAATVPASEAAILSMIRDSSNYSFEGSRSLEQGLSFAKTEEIFKEKGLGFDRPHMRSLKLIGEDDTYTNLALLLSDQCMHQTKAAVFQGTDKLVFKNRKELTGSLFSQMEELIDFIDFYNQTRSEIKGIYRKDSRDYPEDAVREAVFNAYVHRDYSFSSPLLVSIFDDRLEIVSIGGLVKGIELEDIKLGVSVLRNEALANIFYRLKFIEAYGTGIMKIENAYRDCRRKPVFEASANAFKVTLPNMNYNDPEDIGNIFCFKEDIPPYNISVSVSDRAEKIRAMCREKGYIVRKDIEEAFEVSQPMAVIILKDMQNAGVIRRIGKGKNIRYIC